MIPSIDAFIDRFAYDIEHRLTSLLDGLKDDLGNPDPHVRKSAADDICKILSWVYPPASSSRLSDAERRRTILEMLNDERLSASEQLSIAKRLVQTNGGTPGAPRKRGQDAIRALTIHLRSNKSWRQIAYEINGPCGHHCRTCEDVPRPPEGRIGQTQQRKKRCPDCGFVQRNEGQRQQVCYKCVDALRSAVGELEKFLRDKGLYPTVPRRGNPS